MCVDYCARGLGEASALTVLYLRLIFFFNDGGLRGLEATHSFLFVSR